MLPVLARADVKFHSPMCSGQHPDELKQVGHDNEFTDDELLIELNGPVKQVQIQHGSSRAKYYVNKSGQVTHKLYDCDNGKFACKMKFEYDSSNRITSISYNRADDDEKKPTTKAYTTFKYFDDKNMVIKTSTYSGKWSRSTAAIRATDVDGNMVCYDLEASNVYNNGTVTAVTAKKYVLSRDRATFSDIITNTDLPNKIQNEDEAEAAMLVAFKKMQGYSNSYCFGSSAGKDCFLDIKSKDGDFDKFTSSHIGSSYYAIRWYKDSLINEDVDSTNVITDGSIPHGHYKYQFDEHGNWTSRKYFINDIPSTLTNDKTSFRENQNRSFLLEIKYYN